MFLIVDRFEENYAVCEDENRNMQNIKRERLDFAIREGDAITLNQDGLYVKDEDETARRRAIALALQRSLWE